MYSSRQHRATNMPHPVVKARQIPAPICGCARAQAFVIACDFSYPPLEGSRRAKLALWVDANPAMRSIVRRAAGSGDSLVSNGARVEGPSPRPVSHFAMLHVSRPCRTKSFARATATMLSAQFTPTRCHLATEANHRYASISFLAASERRAAKLSHHRRKLLTSISS